MRQGKVFTAKAGFIVAAAIPLALFALAFIVAPRACEGGLEAYFWCGVASLIVLAGLPFPAQIGSSLLVRIGWAAGFVVLGAGAWIAGLVAANVRIICRLF